MPEAPVWAETDKTANRVHRAGLVNREFQATDAALIIQADWVVTEETAAPVDGAVTEPTDCHKALLS